MNKKEFLKILDSLNLDKNSYCIIASGSMLMHNLRDNCNDIDIRVTKELFQELLDKYHMKQSSRYDYVYELNDNIDVNCKNYDPNNIEFVDGYPVEKLEVQLQWMLEQNRPKDKDKIIIIKNYLEKNTNKTEYVDIYDRNKNKTGKTKIRFKDILEDNEYTIGVQLIIFNQNNEILITKRSNTKMVLPGKWECNGGAIEAGETPVEGLIREIKEELGINVNTDKLIFLKTVIKDKKHHMKEVYLYKDNIDINDLRFSDNEVIAAKYVSIDEYMKMFNAGEIVYNVDFDIKDYKKAIELI